MSSIDEFLEKSKVRYVGGGLWEYDNIRAAIIVSKAKGQQAKYKNTVFVGGRPWFNFN
tara:strand:- start:190 stop:363 length:174 start_codon:yes stop_codon:yes gene_type:complete